MNTLAHNTLHQTPRILTAGLLGLTIASCGQNSEPAPAPYPYVPPAPIEVPAIPTATPEPGQQYETERQQLQTVSHSAARHILSDMQSSGATTYRKGHIGIFPAAFEQTEAFVQFYKDGSKGEVYLGAINMPDGPDVYSFNKINLRFELTKSQTKKLDAELRDKHDGELELSDFKRAISKSDATEATVLTASGDDELTFMGINKPDAFKYTRESGAYAPKPMHDGNIHLVETFRDEVKVAQKNLHNARVQQ